MKEDILETYFFLDKRINKTQRRMQEYEEEYNHRNYYTSVQQQYEDLTTVAFNVENEVVNYVTAMQNAERHIEIMKCKQQQFSSFLQGLTSREREYLINRYRHQHETINDRLDALAIAKVLEIERTVKKAFSIKETIEPLKRTDISEALENLERLMKEQGSNSRANLTGHFM